MQSTKITVKRPEQLADLPLLAPRLLSASPVAWPGFHTLVSPKTPN